jgi:putative ABC transport system permease protein
MTQTWLLFSRLVLRPLRKEPVRTILTILAVALGVSVVIAIDLAGGAAAGSFHSSIEALTGNSDILITGTGGVPQNLLGKLVQLPYAFTFSPRIEDFASLDGQGEAIPFIGIDLVAHANSALPGDASTDMPGDNPIWVGSKLELKTGKHVHLLINDQMHEFTVQGQIPKQFVIVADIGLAQTVTGKLGRIDSIDVHVPHQGSIEQWQSYLRKQVPTSVTVNPQGARTVENRKMLSAFRWNLRALSYIALVVGAFLIYNTISISVVRRRNEIGVLRAIGAPRDFILRGFLAEALFFAITGSALGVVMGRVMAIGAVRLIGITVESLYVSSQPSPIALNLTATSMGVGLGIAISLLAALAPSIEASHVAPIEAMARGRNEYNAARRSKRTIAWAIAALIAAAGCSLAPAIDGEPMFGYLSVLLLIVGTAAAIPNIVTWFGEIAHRLLEKLLGIEAKIAMQSLRASLGRTSVLTAALTTAVAMTASVGIMVGSFRETVTVWMDGQLKADFYMRPAGMPAVDRYPTMSDDIGDRIEKIPGVSSIDRFRAYAINYEGMPAILGSADSSRVENTAATLFLPGQNREAILKKLPTGDYCMVSEPFANKHHVKPGSKLSLPVGNAKHTFTVLGVYYDYSTERGVIIVERKVLMKYLPDPSVSTLAVYVKPGDDGRQIRKEIDRIISGRSVLVFENRDLRHMAIEIFDRTFAITYALEAVAIGVAVMGIAGALLAMVIDRRREFALLRFLGAAQGQITRIILCEAGLLGLFSNVIGLIMGTSLSLILIYVINKQSFGWTIQFHWPAAALLGALTGVYLATVIAGLYPARTAIQMNPIEVIHEQ